MRCSDESSFAMAASKLNDSPTDYDSDSITSENQPLNPCLVDTSGGHCPTVMVFYVPLGINPGP